MVNPRNLRTELLLGVIICLPFACAETGGCAGSEDYSYPDDPTAAPTRHAIRARVTDAGLALAGLQTLTLSSCSVGDVGLEHLIGLTNLKQLQLSSTQVTDEGAKQISQALPQC